MKTKKIKILFIGAITIFTTFMVSTIVQANYQSKPNATSTSNAAVNIFFINARNMEASGQVMGKTETINQSNGTATSASNNLDVHMMKNTEYGTIAMLSASTYGQAPNGISTASTTGNNFGIFQLAGGKWEYVAAMNSNLGSNTSSFTRLTAAQARYKNVYTDGNNNDFSRYIPGDATYETTNWFGASYEHFVYSSLPAFFRGTWGLFSFLYHNGSAYSDCGSRGVAVCGEGI